MFDLAPPMVGDYPLPVKEPPPTEKLPASTAPIPGKVQLMTGGVPANVRPTTYTPPVVMSGQKPNNTAIKAGWACLLLGFILACIPGFGMLMWLLWFAPMGIAVLMGLIGMATGRVMGGIVLCLASVTLAPVAYFVVPLLSAAIAGPHSEKQEPESPSSAPSDVTPSPAVEVETSESGVWTDIEGRKMQAKLLDVKRDENRKLIARFEKEDGKIYSFPVDQLLPEDKERALKKLEKD